MNRDPIAYEGSPWNLYEFVGGNPTIGVDPSGKQLGSPFSMGQYNAAVRAGRPYDPHRYTCRLNSHDMGELGFRDRLVFGAWTAGTFAPIIGRPIIGGAARARCARLYRELVRVTSKFDQVHAKLMQVADCEISLSAAEVRALQLEWAQLHSQIQRIRALLSRCGR